MFRPAQTKFVRFDPDGSIFSLLWKYLLLYSANAVSQQL